MSIAPYQVSAFNISHSVREQDPRRWPPRSASGFKGGFVGGVNVYAYMTHQPLQVWGREWLERGTGEAKFGKPVYDGEIAEVSASQDSDGLALTVHSVGVLCATGRAALPSNLPAAPSVSNYKSVAPRPERVAASEQSLPVGEWLGMKPMPVTGEWQAQDLQDIRETDPVYAREGLVHPGTILRCCNWVLTHNVVLPAWIHMGSTVRNLGLARIGDTLGVRACVTKNYGAQRPQIGGAGLHASPQTKRHRSSRRRRILRSTARANSPRRRSDQSTIAEADGRGKECNQGLKLDIRAL